MTIQQYMDSIMSLDDEIFERLTLLIITKHFSAVALKTLSTTQMFMIGHPGMTPDKFMEITKVLIVELLRKEIAGEGRHKLGLQPIDPNTELEPIIVKQIPQFDVSRN